MRILFGPEKNQTGDTIRTGRDMRIWRAFMESLVAVQQLLRHTESVLDGVQFQRKSPVILESRQEQTWSADYRTADGFHCIYAGASAAWRAPDWTLSAGDQRDESACAGYRSELPCDPFDDDVAAYLCSFLDKLRRSRPTSIG